MLLSNLDKILKCDHSNESYWAVFYCGSVSYAVQVVLGFESVDEILWRDHSNESLQYISVVLLNNFTVPGAIIGDRLWLLTVLIRQFQFRVCG